MIRILPILICVVWACVAATNQPPKAVPSAKLPKAVEMEIKKTVLDLWLHRTSQQGIKQFVDKDLLDPVIFGVFATEERKPTDFAVVLTIGRIQATNSVFEVGVDTVKINPGAGGSTNAAFDLYIVGKTNNVWKVQEIVPIHRT